MMKRIKLFCILALFLILVPAADGFACTSVMAAKNDMVLAGHNEDWSNSRHWVNFIPAGAGRFGCFFTSWESDWTIGGVNDQGLFLGDNSVSKTGWHADPAKLNFPGNPRLHILQTCATVADVRKFFETYNVLLLNELHFPFADRTGAAMVVEYAQGKVRFVTEKTWYQISTNFLRTDYPGIEVPCKRFQTAQQMFDSAGELSVPLIRSILSATHQEGNYPTVYSGIYDLKAGLIYVYRNHNFKKEMIFNLDDELKKGAHTVKLSKLFSVQPPVVTQAPAPRDK
jgi:choloylglycine hydrolase